MIDRLFFKKLTGIFLIILTIFLAGFILTTMYKNFSTLLNAPPQKTVIPAQQTAPKALPMTSQQRQVTNAHK